MEKTLEQFIEEHREELKSAIKKALDFVPRQASCRCPKSGTDHYHDDAHNLDDEELRLWILNDETLYRWAGCEGVEL